MSVSKEARGFLHVVLILGILVIIASVYSTVWATPSQSGGMGQVPSLPSGPTLPTLPGIPALATCDVSPVSVTLQAGGTQLFSYTGRNISNTVITGLSVTWSVVAGGGTVNPTSGLFTAGSTSGTFTDTVKGSGTKVGDQTCEALASVVVSAPTEATSTPTRTPTVTPLPTVTPTVTPVPTATPTRTPVPVVVLTPAVLPAVVKAEVKVDVKVEPKTSDQSKGVSSTGVSIEIKAGEAIKIEVVKDKPGTLVIPATLAKGETMKSFEDATTGVKLKDNVLTVPLKDAQGDTNTIIEAKVKDMVGTGTTAEAAVESIKLTTAEQKVDFSSEDSSVGKTGGSLNADLKSIPTGGSVTVKMTKDPEVGANTAFTLAAQDAGTTIRDIAFTMNVTKVNMDPVVGEARIIMSVSEVWVNKYGAANVKIFRFSDTGGREILETRIVGRDSLGSYIFEGISPNGMSVFSLVALDAAPPVQIPAGGAIKAMAPGFITTLTSPDGAVTVAVPADAPVGTSFLLYTPRTKADAPAAPTGLAIGSALFDLKVIELTGAEALDTRFRTPVTVSVKYTADDLTVAQGNPSRLVLYKYDTSLKAWSSLSTTFDPVTKTIGAQVGRLSLFALMGEAKAATPTVTPTPTREPWLPTVTPTITPTPTVTPTRTATPTATTIPPKPGDLAPGSGLLMGLLVVAALLIAAGGYYLRQSKQS
ncbi:MAG: domain containing protein [Dehalococcoidia bacterium]|nr:domain containing protein [Dehalococcoidia bacterium]